MCGIAGFIEFGAPRAGQEDLLAMRQRLRHRGPDDQGHWFKPGVGLAHARLSILDLSVNAHQPMHHGNLVLVYNGEIYNYRCLREELTDLGHYFTSNSDTEVLLCGFAQWGPAVLERLDGMFAFAIYDEGTRTLFLARDRTGTKSLVYYTGQRCFVFASELKALWPYPGIGKEISPQGLEDYLRLGYTTGRNTMFENCFRLLPGESMRVDIAAGGWQRDCYWHGYFTADATSDFSWTQSRLKSLLIEEFKMSLASDVPIGACISGGVDSNVLIAILAKEHGVKIKTYSLGGTDAAFDENRQANAVAAYLGTDHRSLVLDPPSACGLLLDTIAHYDEPMADQNILSLRVIAAQARADGVKVLLSGLGGDELFYGYPTIDLMARLRPLFGLTRQARCLFPKQWLSFSNVAYKAVHLAQQENYIAALYGITGNCFFCDEVDQLMLTKPASREDYLKEVFFKQQAAGGGIVEALMSVDFKSYLTDNGLALTDMSAMAEGVEVRVPYLNSSIVDFALRVPSGVKKYKGELKALLRFIEREYLPSQLTMKEKKGFYPFIKAVWLNHYLQDIVQLYFSEEHIHKQGLFDYKILARLIDLHRRSQVNVTGKLWNMLIFQLWAERHL